MTYLAAAYPHPLCEKRHPLAIALDRGSQRSPAIARFLSFVEHSATPAECTQSETDEELGRGGRWPVSWPRARWSMRIANAGCHSPSQTPQTALSAQ